MTKPLQLRFDAGTLVIDGLDATDQAPPGCLWDPRVGRFRAPAHRYRDLVTNFTQREVAFDDRARAYANLKLDHRATREPFPHQREAVDAWDANGKRGVIVLPTGSGKSYVAELAIAKAERSTLVVAPTLDLMAQWYDLLGTAFGVEIGLLGGGYFELRDLTCATYDSAHLKMDQLGARFGLLVFDECHHLPSPAYLNAADACIAPFRLGLTATLDRADGREGLLDERVGKVVFARGIKELAGEHLAEYETVRLQVHMGEAEAARYREAREVYRAFLRAKGIRMSSPEGWGRFVMLSSQSREGRRAFRAYREQKAIALASEAKLSVLEGLLRQHAHDRVIIFTSDNDTAYRVSRMFLLPTLTHQTDIKERKELLARFRDGTYPALVTSRVLNEGVDVPEANVAVVLSGSGSVREHVQRLGRILRRREGKRATLYEVVTSGTGEEATSSRRREHEAYR
ncbi:MAG: DEAD/DEAH box helicase family protein [Deltaproteobacteria bacterium]|nr:DEAD/DEAH box helicase family protein [Deltaproteobacteria bacterium]